MSLFSKLKSWYCGVRVPVNEPEERDPLDVVGYLPRLTLRIHWTAKTLRYFVDFYLKHWKWLLGPVFGFVLAWLLKSCA